MFLSTLLYRINFHTKASGEVFGYRKFLSHIPGFIFSMLHLHQFMDYQSVRKFLSNVHLGEVTKILLLKFCLERIHQLKRCI